MLAVAGLLLSLQFRVQQTSTLNAQGVCPGPSNSPSQPSPPGVARRLRLIEVKGPVQSLSEVSVHLTVRQTLSKDECNRSTAWIGRGLDPYGRYYPTLVCEPTDEGKGKVAPAY